jgi:hypothetical protein
MVCDSTALLQLVGGITRDRGSLPLLPLLPVESLGDPLGVARRVEKPVPN